MGKIVPKVNESAKFKIIITVSEIRGQDKLVIELIDNGTGMSRDTIINHFWNPGDSKSRGNQEAELYGVFISLYTLYPDEFE